MLTVVRGKAGQWLRCRSSPPHSRKGHRAVRPVAQSVTVILVAPRAASGCHGGDPFGRYDWRAEPDRKTEVEVREPETGVGEDRRMTPVTQNCRGARVGSLTVKANGARGPNSGWRDRGMLFLKWIGGRSMAGLFAH